MQLQIVIQLTAEPGKPGGRKPEDRRRESRICIRSGYFCRRHRAARRRAGTAVCDDNYYRKCQKLRQ